MRKAISLLGLFVMLLFRYPPLPRIRHFHTIEIVQVCRLSTKQLALEYHLN